MKNFCCERCGRDVADELYVKEQNLLPIYYKTENNKPVSNWIEYISGIKSLKAFCGPKCVSEFDKYSIINMEKI